MGDSTLKSPPSMVEGKLDMEQLQIKDFTAESSILEQPSTLFPKITGKIGDLVKDYNFTLYKLREETGTDTSPTAQNLDTILKLIGTVKLHGAHADIVIHSDNTMQLQSRNVTGLSREKDLYNIAKSILSLEAEVLDLKKRYRERFMELNPGVEIKEEFSTIIAGEWIGPGIQKGVAISDLPRKYFVILSVSINNAWLPNEPYADIHSEAVGIYNISRGGFYHEELVFNDVKESREKLHTHTLAVEKECPFAKTFGISGVGEGIVWKAEHPLGSDARFWLKTKGLQHQVTNTERLRNKPGGTELENAKNFAEAAVTVNRLEQGWAYLEEMGIERDMKGIGAFMKWVIHDVEVEERTEIEEMLINQALLKKTMTAMCKSWYMKRLDQM